MTRMQQGFERLTPAQASEKIKHYCAYQERCHAEVKTKLYHYGLITPDVDAIIAMLIQEDYLNEERYAILFAGGKFRIKQWGKNKIKYDLKSKQVSAYCIRKALQQIPDDQYYASLQKLAEKKNESLQKEKNKFIKRKKLQDYLIQKGYESNLVQEVIKEIE